MKKQHGLKVWTNGTLIIKDFPVNRKGRKLIIPFELTKKQSYRITEFYGLNDLIDDEEWVINFDRAINDITQKTINQKIKLATKYFEGHTGEWVRMVKSIKITDKQINNRITKYKKGELRRFQVFRLQ
jgi:hypothetical protein